MAVFDMKTQTAQQKRDAGMALNLTELALVTGYGVSSLRAMKLPLVCGKITWADFWRQVRRLQSDITRFNPSTLQPFNRSTSSSNPATDDDPRSTADKFHAPRSSNARKAASPNRAGSPLRNTA
jgi:hypothetical protein